MGFSFFRRLELGGGLLHRLVRTRLLRLLRLVRETRGAKLSPARVLTMPAPPGDAVLYETAHWLEGLAA